MRAILPALLELIRWANNRVSEGVIALDAALEIDGEMGEWIVLTVSENGPPLTDEEVAGMFQVFAGTDAVPGSAARTIRRGTFQQVMRAMGGDLMVAETPHGKRGLAIRLPRGR